MDSSGGRLDRRQFTRRLIAGVACSAIASRFGHAGTATEASPFRLSVMLWTLQPKYTAEQAIEVVGRAGYNGFELVDEDKRWSAADVTRVRARMAKLGLVCDALSGIDTGFAEPHAGSRLAAESAARFTQAERLGCRRVILLSGKRVAGITREAQHAVCVENLKRVADLAAQRGFELLLEPIDALENPSIYLTHVAEAFAIIRKVNNPAVKVLYDFYHEAQGLPPGAGVASLLSPLQNNLSMLGLVHIADVPGRHMPGTGTMDFAAIYRALHQAGYRGWMVMEFLPQGSAEDELRSARREVSRSIRT